MNSYGIYIGVSTQTVDSIKSAMLEILATPSADAVKMAALDVLKGLTPQNTNISNCSINMESTPTVSATQGLATEFDFPDDNDV